MTTLADRYRIEAARAVAAYRAGESYGQFPPPKAVGYCARAARALWSACHGGRWFPYGGRDADGDGDVDALDMLKLVRRAGLAIEGEVANAYHTAVGHGELRPGSLLFLPYANFGHVVTVVEITESPATSLAHVRVLENTSGIRGGIGPGTILSRLDLVCGAAGSDRIVAVANVEV